MELLLITKSQNEEIIRLPLQSSNREKYVLHKNSDGIEKALDLLKKGSTKYSLVIPEGVSVICDSTFFGCINLTSVIIPNSVTVIGWEAFIFCSNLKSVTIPSSVESIESRAFFMCPLLEEINVTDPNKLIFNKTHDLYLNFEKSPNTLLEFALSEKNYILAINTLFKYRNKIMCSSLPENLKKELFLDSKQDDSIDYKKLITFLLDQQEILHAVCLSKNKDLIDKIVLHSISTRKLNSLRALIQTNNSAAQAKKVDFELLEKSTALRSISSNVFANKFGKTKSIGLYRVSEYFSLNELKILQCTCTGRENSRSERKPSPQ